MGLFDVLNAACVSAFMDRESDEGLVTIQKGAGAAVAVPAIFDSNFYASNDGEFASVDKITSISVRNVDVPDPAPDDRVVARGKSYRVTEIRPDSEGMTVLELVEV